MKKRQKGFTLAEMIVSIAVLSVVTIYLVQMFIATKNLSIKSYEIDQSVRISKNIINLVSSGANISQDSDDILLANMKKKSEDNYELNLDENFEISKDENSMYTLNMNIDKKIKGIKNIKIQIQRLKPYILKKDNNLMILEINSSKMD